MSGERGRIEHMFEQSPGTRLEAARAALAQVEARVGVTREAGERAWPLTEPWSELLPSGLPRGRVVSVESSTSLLLALAGQASEQGAWTAVVGMPAFGAVAAARRGVELSRLALIPHPGAQAAEVIGLCLEGVDVVLAGPRLALSDADRRRVAARARERGALILAVAPWAGADVALTVERVRWAGLGAGEGRLREREATVAVGGRRVGAVRRVRLLLDADAGLRSRSAVAGAQSREEVA